MGSSDEPEARSGFVRGPQSFVAGVTLVAFAAYVVWLGSDLPLGTLNNMGPGLLPRWLAYAVGVSGLALAVTGVLRPGDALEGWGLRGPVMVLLAIAAFAATLRPVQLGAVTTVGLGLCVAGPLCILIGGYASPEARLRELVILGLALTAACMLLFGDLLNLPIPMVPTETASLLPGWSQKAILRTVAAAMLAAAGLLAAVSIRPGRKGATIDVATHSVHP